MKLYTEEQVDKMLSRARLHKQDDTEMFTNEYLLSQETPIELPSNEEIEDYAKEFVLSHDFSALTNPNHLANRCFQLGAKWMKEQILNQNK